MAMLLLTSAAGLAAVAGPGASATANAGPGAGAPSLEAPRGVVAAPPGALIFESDDAMRPAYVDFFLAFRSAVVAELNGPMAIYTENFDLARLGRPGYLDEIFDWHCRKYRGRDLRVIVPIGDPAYEHAIRWRDSCSPGTPIVFANVTRQAVERIGRPPATTGLTQSTELAEVIRIAFDLLPATRRIAVVGGPVAGDVYARDFLASVRSTYRVEVLDLTGLPMPDLLERVSSLPPDTFVAFTSLITDGAGRAFAGPDAARMVSRASTAPMFGLATPQLGHGTIGGRLLSPGQVGRDVAAIAVRVFQGEPADSIPVRDAEILEYAFDAAQMQRWGLDLDVIPPGSRVINRRATLWEEHRETVIATVAALVLQAVLIAALLRERRRRQRVNVQLHRLSGELITSQEKERSRVARELHDDVGQQLALLSIELEQLRAQAGASIETRLAEVAGRANAISIDVHNLARDLHPARLETLGLPRALRAYAEEASKRHAVEVAIGLVDWPDHVSAEQALTLYRIAQEAVQNAVRHGGATIVSIELVARARELAMTVADDGQGFAAVEGSAGIGLVGMRERASLVGGSVSVESEPGEGTTVRVVLPAAQPGPAASSARPGDHPPEAGTAVGLRSGG